MKTELKRLREERNRIVAQMQELHSCAEKENRGFNADEEAAWTKAEADLTAIEARIKRVEKLDDVVTPAPSTTSLTPPSKPEGDEALSHRSLFSRYIKVGIAEMSVDEREAVKEKRAFTAGTGNTGGFSVPEDFMARLEVALLQFGAMWDVAEIIETDTGALMPWPGFNYSGQSAAIVGEGTTSGDDTTTPFNVTNFNAYTYRSNMLRVSLEYLQDTAFDEGFIVQALGEALGRGTNAHFTTGTGTGQPQGIATGAALGRTGTTGQTTTVIYDDLVFLIHSVDPAYRMGARASLASSLAQDQQRGPRVGFMMNDASVGIVRRLKDSQGLPIWIPSYVSGIASGVPDTLLGYPVWTNQSVATMAANARSILFGKLDSYKIRRVRSGIQILRLQERYADNLQVGFIGFLRCDGRLLDAGTNPVKYYANSAT